VTASARAQLEKDVLYDVVVSQRECAAIRARLAQIAEPLLSVANALIERPEVVTPLPRVDDADYREGLNLLACREEVVKLCNDLRTAEECLSKRQARKVSLGF